MSLLFINETLRLNNLKTTTVINAKISVFIICVKAVIYLLLYDLHNCTFNSDMHEIFLQHYHMKEVLRNPPKKTISYLNKWFFFDKNQTRVLFNKENTKVEQSCREHLYIFSERDITLQKQHRAGSPTGLGTIFLSTSFI